jgi:hypothetical protein
VLLDFCWQGRQRIGCVTSTGVYLRFHIHLGFSHLAHVGVQEQ